MTSTVAPPRATAGPPSAPRRFGYLVSIAVNGVLLWMAHQLLGWGWPGFLTPAFDDVLGLLSASFVVSMVVNAGFLVRDRGWFRALADLVTSGVGLAVVMRMWDVFPFDFSGYQHDWSWAFRIALVVGFVGTLIGIVVNAVTLGAHLLRPGR